MAQELDDPEFFLPSHFLTDDDILFDFPPSADNSICVFGSGSGSDLDLPSIGSVTGSETDHDELLSELTRQIASFLIPSDCSPLSKDWDLSSSPQSTLCRCVEKEEGSSRDSPNGQVSPPSSTNKKGGATTLDLLNKAAGEVARFMMTEDKTTTATRAGTGFFDCSSNGQFYPPPSSSISTLTCLPFFSSLHRPPFSHVQQQTSIRRQQMINWHVNIINNKSKEPNHKNSPVGSLQTAWTPLQARNQPIRRSTHMCMGQHGPKRGCVGTGVFLPRRVDAPVDTCKKPEGDNTTKTRNGKSSNKSSNSHQHRSGSKQTTSKSTEIRLPPEWIY